MSILDDLWDATILGKRQQATQSQRLADEFALLKQAGGPQTEKGAKILAGIQQNPQFIKLQKRMDKSLPDITSTMTAGEKAGHAGYSQLTPEEQKQLVLNPRGYRAGSKEKAPFEKMGEIGLAMQRMDNAGLFEDNPELKGSLTDYVQSLVPEDFRGSPEPGVADEHTEPILSTYFSSGLEEMKANQPKGKYLASKEMVGDFRSGFADKAKNLGVKGREAEAMFNEFYEEEVGKKGMFRNDVLPTQPTKYPSDYFSYELGGEQAKAPDAATPKKSLLRRGKEALASVVSPVKEAAGAIKGATGEIKSSIREQVGLAKPLKDYKQASTETVPEENIPKSFVEIGIGKGDQESFLDLEKALPDMDLRSDYERDPQFFQTLLKALREGKIDMKKALEIIQAK